MTMKCPKCSEELNSHWEFKYDKKKDIDVKDFEFHACYKCESCYLDNFGEPFLLKNRKIKKQDRNKFYITIDDNYKNTYSYAP